MKKHFLILLLAATSLSACSHLGAQTNEWLGTGEKDKQAALEKMTKDGPQVSGVNATMEKQATDATAQGDYRRAGQFYKQLVDSPKSSADDKIRYKLGMAESARRAGEPQIAIPIYEALLKEQPEHVEAMEGYGLSLMQTGKAVDAGREFSDIMKIDPKRWRTLNGLGILFVNKNMLPEADAYFTEALKYSPDNPAVLNNLALSQAADHNFARAFQTFEQAAHVSRDEAQRKQISLNTAMVYGISGDLETARDIASKYLSGPALDNNLGLYAHLAKDDKLARTYLDMALSGSQDYYERAWNNLDIVDQKSKEDSD
jgi:Flp pilus assembly protein TadD